MTAPAKVGDYWPRYRRRAILYTIAIQVIATLTVGCALVVTGVLVSTAALIVILTSFFAASAIFNFILVTKLLVPLGDMAAALTHISGEQTIVTPPNPNDRH